MIQMVFIVVLLAGLLCAGGFLWSMAEGRPRPAWLVGAGTAFIVAIAGLIIRG